MREREIRGCKDTQSVFDAAESVNSRRNGGELIYFSFSFIVYFQTSVSVVIRARFTLSSISRREIEAPGLLVGSTHRIRSIVIGRLR